MKIRELLGKMTLKKWLIISIIVVGVLLIGTIGILIVNSYVEKPEVIDSDVDGIEDLIDNCPTVPNYEQEDTDGDGIGDACEIEDIGGESDIDGDGIPDRQDNCPVDYNPSQLDTDGNGIGNVCQIIPSGNLTENCEFISADWSSASALEGEIVNLTVRGQNCDGERVRLDIYKAGQNISGQSETVDFEENDALFSWTIPIGGGFGVGLIWPLLLELSLAFFIYDFWKYGMAEKVLFVIIMMVGVIILLLLVVGIFEYREGILLSPAGLSEYYFDAILVSDSSVNITSASNLSVTTGADLDGDGIGNDFDNCVNIYNPNQEDIDSDGDGDVCDDDIDGDAILNDDDACPFDSDLQCSSSLAPIINDYAVDADKTYKNYWMKTDQTLPFEILDCVNLSSGELSYVWLVDDLFYSEEALYDLEGSDFDVGEHEVIGYCYADGLFDRQTFNLEILGFNDFTIVALPDTQIYTKQYPEIFDAQTQWIADLSTRLEIAFVTHEGDVVDDPNRIDQWTVADGSMAILDDGGIVYGAVPGNHDYNDYDAAGRTLTNYNSYFPLSRFQSVGDSYSGTADNFYQTFEVNGVEFMIVNYEYCPRDGVLDWANDVVGGNPNKRVILTTHLFIGSGGRVENCFALDEGDDHNDGESQWEKFVKNHGNIFLVNSGHLARERYYEDFAVYGNKVHQILANYQFDDIGGNGYLRAMVFRPEENRIDVKSYSPFVDGFYTDSDSEFSMDYSMDGSPFALFKLDEDDIVIAPSEFPFGVNLDGSNSLDFVGTITDYSWDINGDGEEDVNGEQVVYSFTALGSYDITLTVTDNDGKSDSTMKTLILRTTECSDGEDNDFDDSFDMDDIDCVDDADDWEGHEATCEDADLNGDGFVNSADQTILIANYDCVAPPACVGDLNQDGVVDFADLNVILQLFGECPP